MLSKSGFKTAFVIVCTILTTSSSLYAGWIQKDADGCETYISDGKIKFIDADTENSHVILDTRNNRIILVDADREIYAAGTLDAYCQMMEKMAQSFGETKTASGGLEEKASPSVQVVAAGQDTVAGMKTDKYKVLVDGKVYEEIWLTTDAGLKKDLGRSWGNETLLGCLSQADSPVESAEAYRELSKKGWELRNISYEFGEMEYIANTVSLEQKPIPDSEFAAPGAYKKLNFEEFFNSSLE